MKIMEVFFWFALSYLAFIYVGYGMLICCWNRLFFRKKLLQNNDLPVAAIVIAAYNEEGYIRAKLQNTLTQDCTYSRFNVYVVTDGSYDATNDIVREFPEVRLLWHPERKGKASALNRVMRHIKEPVTIFTDANVMLSSNAIARLLRHFQYPEVGAVSGEKRVLPSKNAGAADGEGLYWKYESFLKKQDAQFGTLMGAAGELFAIRTSLYAELPEDTLLDDFMISMEVIRRGYTIAYDPGATASELPSAGLKEEFKRKVRIAAGGIQSVLRLPERLNPFNGIRIWFQYFFHRFSRWMIAPFLLPLLFIANMIIAQEDTLYLVLLLLQIMFHGLATLGWLQSSKGQSSGVLRALFYFDFMHYCALVGWWRALTGSQPSKWEKAARIPHLIKT